MIDLPHRTRPRLLLISNARWGKNSVGDLLEQHGYKCFHSSTFATEQIMMPYFAEHGNPYTSTEACFADRVNHRKIWHDEIERYNLPTYTRMTWDMINGGYDVYVGMRSRLEFTASRHLYDRVIWIDASQRLPAEGHDSNGLNAGDADEILDNNGTLTELSGLVVTLLEKLALLKLQEGPP